MMDRADLKPSGSCCRITYIPVSHPRSPALLHRHAARDLAHGLEEGERAVRQADGFEGHGADAGFDQRAGEGLRGGEVEKGEKRLPLSYPAELGFEGLLDLDDQLSAAPNLIRPRNDLGAHIGYHDQGLPVIKYAGFGNAVNQ